MIATFHLEVGLVTTATLDALVSRLDPEVVFVECPPGAMARYLHGDIDSPESAVARRLHAGGRVPLVPVDLPTPEDSFFSEHAELIRRVEVRNRDFRNLSDLQGQRTRAHGYRYLNSDASDQLLAMIEEEIRLTVELYAEPQLAEAHARWNRQNREREKGMVRAIEDYFERHDVSRGVFMIGAAHRRAMMERAKSGIDAGGSGLIWDFSAFADSDEPDGNARAGDSDA